MPISSQFKSFYFNIKVENLPVHHWWSALIFILQHLEAGHNCPDIYTTNFKFFVPLIFKNGSFCFTKCRTVALELPFLRRGCSQPEPVKSEKLNINNANLNSKTKITFFFTNPKSKITGVLSSQMRLSSLVTWPKHLSPAQCKWLGLEGSLASFQKQTFGNLRQWRLPYGKVLLINHKSISPGSLSLSLFITFSFKTWTNKAVPTRAHGQSQSGEPRLPRRWRLN